jgi:hypothetical protein
VPISWGKSCRPNPTLPLLFNLGFGKNVAPFQGPPNLTKMGIFGLKTNHLATLVFWWHKNGLIKNLLLHLLSHFLLNRQQRVAYQII